MIEQSLLPSVLIYPLVLLASAGLLSFSTKVEKITATTPTNAEISSGIFKPNSAKNPPIPGPTTIPKDMAADIKLFPFARCSIEVISATYAKIAGTNNAAPTPPIARETYKTTDRIREIKYKHR